jgi:hypothetical protein
VRRFSQSPQPRTEPQDLISPGDDRLNRTILAAFLVAAGLGLSWSPAVAQEAPGWRQVPIEGGCTVAVRGGLPAGSTMTWDQQCTPGRAIAGEGSAILTLSDGRSISVTGNYVAGVPHGAHLMVMRNAAGVELNRVTGAEFNMGCQITLTTCTPYTPN